VRCLFKLQGTSRTVENVVVHLNFDGNNITKNERENNRPDKVKNNRSAFYLDNYKSFFYWDKLHFWVEQFHSSSNIIYIECSIERITEKKNNNRSHNVYSIASNYKIGNTKKYYHMIICVDFCLKINNSSNVLTLVISVWRRQHDDTHADITCWANYSAYENIITICYASVVVTNNYLYYSFK